MSKVTTRSIYRLGNKPDERVILRYLAPKYSCTLVPSASVENTIVEGTSQKLRQLRTKFHDIVMHGTVQAALILAIPHRDDAGLFAEPRTVAAGFWRAYADTVCHRLTNGKRHVMLSFNTTYAQAGLRAGEEVEL